MSTETTETPALEVGAIPPVQFSVIIVAYRSAPWIAAALEALRAQTFTDFEIVVVDNACPDDSAGKLDFGQRQGRIVRLPENLGFAGGANRGAEIAEGEWLVFLNPDARPDTTWLAEIAKGVERHPAVRVFGTTQYADAHPIRVDGFGDALSIFGIAWRGGTGRSPDGIPDEDRVVLSPCAAAAAYHRDVFHQASGFDEGYFCYLEDVDLGCRLAAMGWPCVQLREAVVTHVGGTSSADRPEFPALQTERNASRLIMKTTPGVYLALVIPAAFASRIYLTLRRFRDRAAWRRLRIFATGWTDVAGLWAARRSCERMSAKCYKRHVTASPRDVREQSVLSWPTLEIFEAGSADR